MKTMGKYNTKLNNTKGLPLTTLSMSAEQMNALTSQLLHAGESDIQHLNKD